MQGDTHSKQAGSRIRPRQQLGRDAGGRRGGSMRYSEAPAKRRGRQPVKAGRFATLALFLVLALGTLLLVIVPQATGSQTYALMTESMAPAYPRGTLVVVKPAEFSHLGYGDIVTFQLEPGRPDVRTQRIVGFAATDTGEKTLITRADNHDVADPVSVRDVQMEGKLFYSVPLLGYLDSALDTTDLDFWMAAAAAGLIGSGVLLILRIIRHRLL